MKIIKHGKNYIRYGKCDCGCEFEYDRKDTKALKKVTTINSWGATTSYKTKFKKSELNDDEIEFYVTCPECGNRVSVEREI